MAKILIVDDDATNRKLVVALLSHDGHMTFEARDGVDGLEVARKELPQLIISDILMPTMDGYEFVRQLRADPQLCSVPVVFHTAHYHEREAHRLAESCGVACVLVKPCLAAKMLQTVEQVLAGVSESDADELAGGFDRAHLMALTNRLVAKASMLGASNARLLALARSSREVSIEAEPHAILEEACDRARSLLGARFGVLAVRESSGARSVLFATSGINTARDRPEPPLVEGGPLGAMVAAGRTWRMSGEGGRSVDTGLPAGYPAAGAVLAAPFSTPMHSYGWLCLADKLGADGFDAEDEVLLRTVCAQFARLYASACAQIEGQLHLQRVYALLSGATALLVRPQPSAELFLGTCRLAVEQGNYRFAGIGRVDSPTGKLIQVAAAGDAAALLAFGQILPGDGARRDDLVVATIRTGQPGICNDLGLPDPRVYRREALLERGYRAVAVLPVMLRGVTLACLVLGTGLAGLFDARELRLLTEVSAYVARGLDIHTS